MAERRVREKLGLASTNANYHVTTCHECAVPTVMVIILQLVQQFIRDSSKERPAKFIVIATC